MGRTGSQTFFTFCLVFAQFAGMLCSQTASSEGSVSSSEEYSDSELEETEDPAPLLRLAKHLQHELKDTENARSFYRQAAMRGSYEAHLELGILLSAESMESQKDEETALFHFQSAARGRVPRAHYFLGKFYLEGRGGFRASQKLALHQFQAGADLGDPDCLYFLARFLELGRPGLIEKDGSKAKELFKRAADAGHPDAIQRMRFFAVQNRLLDPKSSQRSEATPSSENTNAVECAVCLEPIQTQERNFLATKCKHQYHWECVKEWWREHGTCPHCRAPI